MKGRPKMPKVRGGWAINPRTRVKPSDKLYDRLKLRLETKKAITGV